MRFIPETFFFFKSDVNHEMDVRPHGWEYTPRCTGHVPRYTVTKCFFFLRTLLCAESVTSFTHPTVLRNTTTQQVIFSVCGSVNASNNYKKGGEGTTSDTF